MKRLIAYEILINMLFLGIKDKTQDHALISVQFDDNYLLSSKPPTVKLLPRIFQENEDAEETSVSPSKTETKKSKKQYLDAHLNTLFSSVMVINYPMIFSTLIVI